MAKTSKSRVSRKAKPLSNGPAIDESEALALVQRLMAVPGRSRQEGQIAQEIRQILIENGVSESTIQHDQAHRRSTGEVGNLIVKIPGTTKGPRRLFMAHMDTVPICVGSQPRIQGDYVVSANPNTGLGADDRAGVATVLTALIETLRSGLPHPPLTLFFAVQEEIGLCGARYVTAAKLGKPALCFNWDGNSADEVIIGATGGYSLEINLSGIPAHAGIRPQDGVSAASIAALAIVDLMEQGWHGQIQKGTRTGTSNIGYLHGGEATNVVMPDLVIRAEARSHDAEFRKEIVAAFRESFTQAVSKVKASDGRTGSVRFVADLKYDSFRLAEDHPAVQAAMRAITAVGGSPQFKISNGGLDANWMTLNGFPTVTFGCGQQNIHTAQERLHIPSYLKACRTAFHLATEVSR